MQKDFIDFIKNRASIVDILSKKVKLSRSGKDWLGLCPFHSEKTASFRVDPEGGYYHCFGCGAHGDVITFIMETERLSFSEAVENIANIYGIQIPKEKIKLDQNDKVYSALDAVKNLFISQLNDKAGINAKTYLESRKISEVSIKKFQLGFSHDKLSIIPQLKKLGFTDDTLLKTGVFFRSKHDNSLVNRFYGRIIFPIFSPFGKCIGFGGRLMEKSNAAKYINSPETEVFIKSQNLYGYNIARHSKSQEIVIVEGYMDVIAMHQAGFGGAVASLGTSISEAQMHMCWKISNNPVIALDGDDAGIKASYRWIDKILPVISPGKSFNFAKFPQGTDPDSLIDGGHADTITEAIVGASPLVEWMWDGAFQLYPASTPEQKAAIVKMLVEKSDLIKDVSVKKLYKYYIKQQEYELYKKKDNRLRRISTFKPVIPVQEKIEKILVVTIINHPYILDKIIESFAKIKFKCHQMKNMQECIIDAYSNYYLNGEKEKYLKEIEKLEKDIADLSNDAMLHAAFSAKKTDDESVIDGWFAFYEKYSSDPEIAEDLQRAASSLKSSFSNDDWRKLQALKKEVLLNNNKRRDK